MHPPQVFEPLQAGDPPLVGGYRVLARLGAGGMGRVFLATTQSGRRLAVKVVRPEFADDPEFRRRFQQEIAAAQRVQSLYTAPVIDAHPDGPMPWMATAHVPGPSLAQAVAEHGPMPAETLRVLFAGIAEALAAVHAAGVIHRDLKPSNVLLAADGPRVIDFGISRATDSTPLTRTGMRIGSPQFMAPEQALGHDSTPALDVFALGSVMHFAATGRTPFGDGPDTAVLFRIAHEEPNLDGCPDDLRPLLEKCLAKDPSERPTPKQILTTLEPAEGVPDPDWLPADVTRVLSSYAGEPPRPVPPDGMAPTTPYTSYMPAGSIPPPPPGAQAHPGVPAQGAAAAPPVHGPGTPPPGPGPGTPPPPGHAPGTPPPSSGVPAPGHGTPPPGHAPGTPPPAAAHALGARPPGQAPTQPPHVAQMPRPPAGMSPAGMPHPAPPGVPPRPVSSSSRNVPIIIGAGALGVIVVLSLLILAATSSSGGNGKKHNSGGPVAAQSSGGGGDSPSPSDGSSAVGTSKPVGGQIGHYTGINLAEQYRLSLTNDPKHPTKDSGDVKFYGLDIGVDGSRFSVLGPGQAGSYEACRDNTRYTDQLDQEYMVKGKMICVYTDSGIVGLMKITGMGTQPSDYLALDLTVWQGVPPTPGG